VVSDDLVACRLRGADVPLETCLGCAFLRSVDSVDGLQTIRCEPAVPDLRAA